MYECRRACRSGGAGERGTDGAATSAASDERLKTVARSTPDLAASTRLERVHLAGGGGSKGAHRQKAELGRAADADEERAKSKTRTAPLQFARMAWTG